MARAAKAKTTTKPTAIARKPGRPAGVAAKTGVATKAASSSTKRTVPAVEATERRKPGRPAKAAPVAALPKPVKAPRDAARALTAPTNPKASKGELRAQVEKLEHLVATLRAKSRETNRAAKAATARIAELEAQVAHLEKASAAVPMSDQRPLKPARAKRRIREFDPGDAVPPGVAVQEPAPLDEEAEQALENLEGHLGRD